MDETCELRNGCDVCGANSYVSQDGFYYCSVCHTQSQQSQHFVQDEEELFRLSISHSHQVSTLKSPASKTQTSKRQRKTFQLSSWEVYNIALHYFTNKLIENGFSPLLRPKVFQIWRVYLDKREAIFCEIDENEEKRIYSAISLTEPIWNRSALFDRLGSFHRSKMKKIRSSSRRALKRAATISRKEAFMSSYKEDEEESSELIDRKLMTKIHYTAPSRALSTSLPKLRKKLEKIRTSYKRNSLRGESAASTILKPEKFTNTHLFILLYVAARQIGTRILYTDLLRLICDGNLYLKSIVPLLSEEESKNYNKKADKFLVHMNSFLASVPLINDFVKYVGIANFKFPQIDEFLLKFTTDLALPREFHLLLVELVKQYPFSEMIEDFPTLSKWVYVPEIIILSLILFLFTMLFGLDDYTECYQSRFASIFNNIIKEQLEKYENLDERGKWTKLFVFEEWMNFINYREELVSAELFSPSFPSESRRDVNLKKANNFLLKYSTTIGAESECSLGFSLDSYSTPTLITLPTNEEECEEEEEEFITPNQRASFSSSANRNRVLHSTNEEEEYEEEEEFITSNQNDSFSSSANSKRGLFSTNEEEEEEEFITPNQRSSFSSSTNRERGLFCTYKKEEDDEYMSSNESGSLSSSDDKKGGFSLTNNFGISEEERLLLSYISSKNPKIKSLTERSREIEIKWDERKKDASAKVASLFSSLSGEVDLVAEYSMFPNPTSDICKAYEEAVKCGEVSYSNFSRNKSKNYWEEEGVRRRIDFIIHQDKYRKIVRKAGYKLRVIEGRGKDPNAPKATNCLKQLTLYEPYKSFTNLPHSASFSWLVGVVVRYLDPMCGGRRGGNKEEKLGHQMRSIVEEIGKGYKLRGLDSFVPLYTVQRQRLIL